VRRAVLIVLFALLLAGCGGEKVVSPTGPVKGTLPTAAKGDAAAGKKVFVDTGGCGACHTFQAAGTSGTLGPDLDKVLQGKDAQFIETSIKDPSAFVETGYPDAMPKEYASQLTSQQIADLVAFLTQK
jgi:mono/diheme cytochrome c family protein